MKKIRGMKLVSVALVSLLMSSPSLLANESVLLYAETIKTISQDLAKNYFYIEQGIQTSSAKKGLKKDILALDDNIRKLQKEATSASSKQIIEFMFFSVDELKATMREPINAENGGLVLDYTETLLEGSDSIAKHNKGKIITMLNVVEEMEFLLERASKYYIAFRAGYTDEINVRQAKLAVEQFAMLLEKVQAHTYPGPMTNGPIKKLSKYWPVSKDFYLGIEKSELPTIVFISTKHMRSALNKLIVHHKKN
ncbi:MAG: hypothetical protein Q9M36_10925 [Sulfurovum sp.]|nr:hypothetical protein [Sulfurovum sp.]